MAYFMKGELSKAISDLEQHKVLAPNVTRPPLPPRAFLAASYSEAGETAKAARAGRQVLKFFPNFSVSKWPFLRLFKNSEDRDRIINALKMAGLPE